MVFVQFVQNRRKSFDKKNLNIFFDLKDFSVLHCSLLLKASLITLSDILIAGAMRHHKFFKGISETHSFNFHWKGDTKLKYTSMQDQGILQQMQQN